MLVGLLKTILILVAVYYIVTFVNRYFLNKYVKRVQNKQYQDARNKEGKVTLEDRGGKKKRISKDEGEYVDYEEVKE